MLEIRSFIVDEDDGDTRLHLAAFDGDTEYVEQLLTNLDNHEQINRKVRPYGATPIRLASTGGHSACVQRLIDKKAHIDLTDIKGQTPLFVAVQKNYIGCVKLLLENGANPNGSEENRCTPLFIAAKDGCLESVKLLLKYGAVTELLQRLEGNLSTVPGFPLYISAVYHQYNCYAALLLNGAEADLRKVKPVLPASIISQLSLAHTLIRHHCPITFAKLFVEFGGYLWQLDLQGRLVTELLQGDEEYKTFFLNAFGGPLRLQSICRIAIRRKLGRERLGKIATLPVPITLIKFLLYEDLLPNSSHLLVEN